MMAEINAVPTFDMDIPANVEGGSYHPITLVQRELEEIFASIILKERDSITTDEMFQYIKASMARHKVPKYIEFVDSFPMNAAGKILKYKMREDAAKRLGLTGDGADTAGPGK